MLIKYFYTLKLNFSSNKQNFMFSNEKKIQEFAFCLYKDA
jgi:hypothetical protein